MLDSELVAHHKDSTKEDLDTFQKFIPSFGSPFSSSSTMPGLTSQHYQGRNQLSLAKTFEELVQMSRIPLRINCICRRIHEVLTGAKAARCAEEHGLIEANGMREIWRDLDCCWHDLDLLKEAMLQDEDPARRVYIEQYTCGWQVSQFQSNNHPFSPSFFDL